MNSHGIQIKVTVKCLTSKICVAEIPNSDTLPSSSEDLLTPMSHIAQFSFYFDLSGGNHFISIIFLFFFLSWLLWMVAESSDVNVVHV